MVDLPYIPGARGRHARPAIGYAMVLVAATLFGLNGTVSKVVLASGISSLELTQVRSLGACLGFAVAIAIWRPGALRVTRRELPFLAAFGVGGVALVQWLYFLSIHRLPVGIALLLQYLAPGEKWLTAQDPDDRARVWRMLAMEDDRKIVADKTIDEREARIENRRMLLGEMIEPPKPYENQDTHVLIHNEMRKSDEYKASDPIIRMMIDAHVERHLQIAMPMVGVTVPPEMEETAMEGPEPRQGGGGRQQSQQPQQQPAMRPFQ